MAVLPGQRDTAMTITNPKGPLHPHSVYSRRIFWRRVLWSSVRRILKLIEWATWLAFLPLPPGFWKLDHYATGRWQCAYWGHGQDWRDHEGYHTGCHVHRKGSVLVKPREAVADDTQD